jgi:CBS domain containing-hemolysin-like protein
VSRRLDVYLSVNQLGTTLTSLALGWLGEPAFSRLVDPGLVSLLGPRAGLAAGTVMGFVLITFLHAVLGELAPKSVAIQKSEAIALWTALPLRVLHFVGFPLIWVLTKTANLTLRLLGLRPVTEAEMLHSSDELRLILQHVPLHPGARRLIDRVFDYTRRVARHVMTLRRDVVVLRAGLPFEENLETLVTNQYTRYPLVDPETDAVLGYVHIKDVMAALASGRP